MWEREAERLQPAAERWRKSLSPHARTVLPKNFNLPLIETMLLAAGHSDTELCRDIEHGFPLTGTLPDTGVFDRVLGPAKPPPAVLDSELRAALDNGWSRLNKLFDRNNAEPELDTLLAQAAEECKAGKLRGPWKICRRADGKIISTVPFEKWLPTIRFPSISQREGASYRVRPIDVCSASGLNPTTFSPENEVVGC